MIYLQTQNLIAAAKITIGIRIKCIMSGIAYQSQSLEQKMWTSRSLASCNTAVSCLVISIFGITCAVLVVLGNVLPCFNKETWTTNIRCSILTEAMWETSKYFGINKLSLVNYSVSLKMFQDSLGTLQESVLTMFSWLFRPQVLCEVCSTAK